jgi:glycerol-3-phosphate dehydrogenase
MLQQLRTVPHWDMIIIGGGATGLGAALDAASRGYKTLLLEQYDFGKGTSSRSTKLVHGGVRYLAQGNIKLVKEALEERSYLLHNAPHLTRKLAFIVPVYSWWSKLYYGIGLQLYNWLSGKRSLGKTRWLSKKATLQQMPGIAARGLKGGILYYDGQFDDTRLAIDIGITAAAQGATLLNYCKATGFLKTHNRITGLTAEDTLSGESFRLSASVVINATGVFADSVMQLDTPEQDPVVAPSQGIHLVIDKAFFPGEAALMIPKTSDGRVLFAVPWHNSIVLGTTDTPIDTISVEPRPLEKEISFILQNANQYLEHDIQRHHIKAMFAGLRPLVKIKGTQQTSLLSRDHSIWVAASGLVTITGGKWTTYRRMAEDVVNRAALIGGLPPHKCITRQLAIHHAVQEQSEGQAFLDHDFPFTKASIRHFAEEEMAMTVEDVLARRTRVLFLDVQAALSLAPVIAAELAAVLQKDEQWINEQVQAFNELARLYLPDPVLN